MADRVVVGFLVVLGAVLGVGILTENDSSVLADGRANHDWKA